jgi:hypothetical protein
MKHDAMGFSFNVMMHVPKLPDFEECFLEIAIIWTICWEQVLPKYSRILNFIYLLLSSFTHSQILLIPLVDDVQCGYIQN